jgi:hypothetical protein
MSETRLQNSNRVHDLHFTGHKQVFTELESFLGSRNSLAVLGSKVLIVPVNRFFWECLKSSDFISGLVVLQAEIFKFRLSTI